MRRLLRVLPLLLLIVLALSLVSCSSDDGPSGPTDTPVVDREDDWPEERTAFDVTYKPGVVIVSYDTLLALVDTAASDFAAGDIRIGASGSSLEELTVGQAVILEGLDVVFIDGIDVDALGATLHTHPATLEDIVQDGTIVWNTAVRFDTAGTLGKRSAFFSVGNAQEFGFGQNEVTFNGAVGGYDVEASISKQGETATLALSTSQSAGSNTSIAINATSTIKEFFTQCSTVVVAGEVVYRSFFVRDIDAALDLEVGGIETQFKNDIVSLPIELKIPAPIAVLPTWIGIGGSLEVVSTLGYDSYVTAEAHYEIHGTIGVEERQSDFSLFADIPNNNAEVNFVGPASAVSVATVGFDVVLDFPKLSLGVGVTGVATGSVYATTKQEVLLNMAAHYEGGFLVGSCFTGNLNSAMAVGASASFFGLLSLGDEQNIFTDHQALLEEGDYCD